MLSTEREPPCFRPERLAGLDEPVRRFFSHAITSGATVPGEIAMRMHGRIRVGAWLPFTAEQANRRDAFAWRARVGAGPLTLLRVTDRYADGRGSTDGRLFGLARAFRSDDEHTTRSAAGRAALEAATFAPTTLLDGDAVRWHAESDALIVASWTVGPERPEVTIEIDERGAPRTISAMRWRAIGGDHAYVPCGCEIHAFRRFGAVVVPSRVTVGWWFGTPRHRPFFRARIDSWAPLR